MNSRTLIHRRLAAAGAALAVLVPLASVAPAAAASGTTAFSAVRSVKREGECRSGPGDWELRVQRRLSGRIRVEFRVDHIRAGQRWDLYVSDNGRKVAATTRVSRPSTGVRVSRLTRNLRGRDVIRAAAVNARSGSTCVARVRF